MDGNDSLKCIDGLGHTNKCMFQSNYHISSSQVDCIGDDIHLKPRAPGATLRAKKSTSKSQASAKSDAMQPTVCTDNWHAAYAISEETTQVFDQTGTFVSVCCHGLV